MCFVVTCWERADLLALVCGVFCEFVTFPLVSWVRCGTWLYRFLIFATLLTLLKDRHAVTPARLQPAAPRSRVKHSTTEPMRSLLIYVVLILWFYFIETFELFSRFLLAEAKCVMSYPSNWGWLQVLSKKKLFFFIQGWYRWYGIPVGGGGGIFSAKLRPRFAYQWPDNITKYKYAKTDQFIPCGTRVMSI